MLADVGSAAAPHTSHHAVQFYSTDQSLFTTVAEFLSDGLTLDQPAIVIATPSHRDGIEEYLSKRLIDCALARRTGDLVMLDAEETLGQFMIGEEPDDELFEQNVGTLVKQTLTVRGRTVVRAYGEMVDVLWKRGKTEAAIKLEILWNKLVVKHRFALLCGYAMGHFYKKTWQLERVCHYHTRAITPDNVLQFDTKRGA
jgi:MEDS: MEthanogen/methylotroph, DcmR Sensory domain